MELNKKIVEKTKAFVKAAFQANPHYSFNHWSVMYNHSVNVQKIAIKISEKIECNKTLVSLGALLHDIGKTYKADPKILHRDHEKFNLIVSETFLKSLNLSKKDYSKVCNLILHKSRSVEMKIIRDADALAMYFDKKLYMPWIEWAIKNQSWCKSEIERKLNKYNHLNFTISRQLGKAPREKMKKDWNKFQQKHASH